MPDHPPVRTLVVSCVFKMVVLGTIASVTLCAASGASIEGRITNSITGEPVGGVHVRFLDPRSHVYSTETDSTGSYRLTGLDDGEYQGEFTRDGFSDSRGNRFSYVSGFVPVRVDAQLKPWAVLRGRVLDEDLKPVAGVPVEKEPNSRGNLDRNTVTNENGEFVFQDMAPGSYTVVARPEAKFRIEDGVRLGTVPIYYPSATAPAEAVRIAVRTGQSVAGIEIRLKSVPVHRVAGVVLNDAGKPAAHATVKLMGPSGTSRKVLLLGMIMPSAPGGRIPAGTLRPEVFTIAGPSPEPEMARVETHDDGTFELGAVEPGDWRLSVEDGVGDDMQRGGVASVSVIDKDIEDVRIRVTSSFLVAATWEGAKDPASAASSGMPFILTPIEAQPRVIVDDTGDLRKMNSVFPGRYRVMPTAVQMNSHIAAVMWGGRDVNGQVVDLAPGAPPFHVILSSEFGKVRGTVEKGEGTTVFLVSRETGDILTYRQVECGAGGAFEFGKVPPGDYYAVAFDRAETSGLPAAELPAVIASIASTVRVEADSAAQVDLRVNKWPW
jgi:hypothetical protein